MRYSAPSTGFSLIEVLLSIGIISFALTAIIGLITVGIGSVKTSDEDTLIASMAHQLMDDLQSRYFVDNTIITNSTPPPVTVVRHPSTSTNILTGTGDVAYGSIPTAVTPVPLVFFDSSGLRLTYVTGASAGQDMDKAHALAAGALYECKETLQGDAKTLSATGSNGSIATQAVNLLNVTLTFIWPVQASNPPNSRIIHGSIVRH